MQAIKWAKEFQRSAQEVSKNHGPSIAQASTSSPRLFQMAVRGRTPWRIGLSSSDLQVGDLICWLQFPRRAVVVRPYGDKPPWKLQVVGTAVITTDIRETTLGHSQRQGWNDGFTKLTIFLDARTIFVLLAD
ncbi:hypothetical protein NXS19_013018 [Fusarium pseudograminearum]|nr:hypothetical protein NXS19_013018 [Fusarium pseudograminearum]